MNNKIKLIGIAALAIISFVAISFFSGEQESNAHRDSPGERSLEMQNSRGPIKPSADNVSDSYRNQVHELEAYLDEHPADTVHIIRLARLYQNGHQPEKAAPLFKSYLGKNPTDSQTWLDLASCYGKSGNWEGAMNATQQLLKLEPDNASAMYNLGAIYANQGNNAEALKWWNKVLETGEDQHLIDITKQSVEKLKNS